MTNHDLDTATLAGQLIVGGFDGETLPGRYERALREGRRGGAIVFRRNLPSIASAARLCEAIRAASLAEMPPFIGVDQEGGRVARLPAPFVKLPPMRVLGAIGDVELTERAAEVVGRALAAVGYNLDFAPVLDVDSNPDNPIIGDRSFGRDPALVAEHGLAFARGLERAGVLACGKHFPGHGDTSVDSHVGLPIIHHDKARLDAIELVPFRAAARAGLSTLMSAHVVCETLAPGVPATLSRAVCTDLLRGELGYEGVLFSDDLEMAAVADRYPVEDSAVLSIEAGCDALLICKDEEMQDRAHEALVRRIERDGRFRERCLEALSRVLAARRRAPPRPLTDEAALMAIVGSAEGPAVLDEIARRAAA